MDIKKIFQMILTKRQSKIIYFEKEILQKYMKEHDK